MPNILTFVKTLFEMITGFKPVYYGHKEPRNTNVLWLRPTHDHDGAEIFFFGPKGWMLCGDWSVLTSVVKNVIYSNDGSVLSFYNVTGDLIFSLTLENLNETIALSVTDAEYDSDAYLIRFYNQAGEELFTMDVTQFFTAGDGISLTGNTLSVDIDPDSEAYLTVSESGLKLVGVDAIAGRVTTAETNISSLGTRMDTAEADIDSLETRMTTAESDIDSLETRMTTAESDIDTAEADIDNLETRMDTTETDIDNLEETTTSKLVAYGKYESDGQYINLYASDGTLLSQIDAAAFVIDGMINTVSLVVNPTGYDDGSYLYFVFNTDAGKEPIYVNLSSLITLYTAGAGIAISDENAILLDESYFASLLNTYVKYESDYDTGLTVGHLDVNNDSTDLIIPYASSTQTGVMSVGTGLSAGDDGEISVDADYIDSLIGESEYVTSKLAASLAYVSSDNAFYLYAYDGTVLSTVDVSGLVSDGTSETYTATNGVDITDNVITAVKSENSENYLVIDETGIAVIGVDDIEERITALQSKVAALVQDGEYYVEQWEDGASSPDMLQSDGNEEVADLWRPALIDCTDNEGETTGAAELNRTNFLRYADGTYSPTVGITEDMRAQCDVALYLDAEASEQYCAAGEFDAEKFYNEYGVSTPLYDADGNEIEHILRPWETTETKYSIVVGNKKTLYLLDQQVGESGYENKGVFTAGGSYDGFNFTGYKLAPTGLFASPVTTIDDAARSFFFAYCTGQTNCQSYTGTSGVTDMFYQKGTYPRTNDISQYTNTTYARANNADASASYPFSEGGDFALNLFITCLELQAGSKYLIDPSMFGSGISSDDACSSESTWLANGGVRYRVHTDDDSNSWSYCLWSSSSHSIYYASGSRTAMTATLNQEYPKEQCMESQMALSYAVETGVAEGEEFEFYGGTYWWESVEGVPSIADGHMNARVYKLMTGTVSGYDSSGTATDFDVEVVLRMSIFEGMSLSGDVFSYWGGGLEMIMDVAYSYDDQNYGNNVTVYMETDQKKFLRSSTVSVSDGTTYDMEDSYQEIGSCENVADGYAMERMSYTSYKTENGGARNTYECYYSYTRNNHSTTTGIRVRLGSRRRGYAHYSHCSPRYLSCHYLASNTNRYYAGSAQALIEWK